MLALLHFYSLIDGFEYCTPTKHNPIKSFDSPLYLPSFHKRSITVPDSIPLKRLSRTAWQDIQATNFPLLYIVVFGAFLLYSRLVFPHKTNTFAGIAQRFVPIHSISVSGRFSVSDNSRVCSRLNLFRCKLLQCDLL